MNKALVTLTFLLLCLPGLAESPCAMITNLNGHAFVVVKDSKNAPATPMMSLMNRSLLEIRGGSKVTVAYFASGNHEVYTGPTLIGIGKDRGTVFHGDKSARQVLSSESPLIQAIDPNALNEVSPPGANNVEVAVSNGKVVFTWPAERPGPYLVSVFQPAQDSSPRTTVWTDEVASTTVTYQGSQLNPQLSYAVEVVVARTVLATSLFRSGTGVQQLTAAKAESQKMANANPSDPSAHVLMSTVYTQHGQHQAAADSVVAAVNSQPNESAFMNRLSGMFSGMSKVAESQKWNDRARYVEDNAPQGGTWGTGAYYDSESWDWEGE